MDTTSDAPIAFGDDLRRVLLGLRRAKSNVDRLKLVGKLPAALGVEIPTNGEPRTGLSMGEHAAITAKQMGVKRVDQDELAAASHRNMAAAYDRGFFDDLVTPFLGLYRDNNLRADSSAEKLAKLKPVFGVKNGDATMTAGNSTPLTDGASVALLSTEEWAAERNLPVLAYFVDGETAAVDYVNGDDGLLMAPDLRGAAAAGPKRPDPAGLRLLRDPRGVRLGGAGDAGGVGVRRVLQGAARPGSARWAASTAPSSTSTARRWRQGTRSPPPVDGSWPSWPSSWRRRRPQTGQPVRGLISICAAGGQGVTAILEA